MNYLFTLLALATALNLHAAPHVFHISKSALPGEIVGIHGDQFGSSPTVWIDHLESGDTVANPEVQLLDVLTVSNQYIGVKLPEDPTLAHGLYAVFVRDGSSDSAPAWVNRASGWHYLDLAGNEIISGTTFRISGRNLAFAGATPQVRFVRVSDGAILTSSSVGSSSESHVIGCIVPAGMTTGQQYYVEVNNGFSSIAAAWTRVPGAPLMVRSGTGDPFFINVPWGSDFNTIDATIYNVKNPPYNAAGDGVADDRAAIQAAIDAASLNPNGGTVYFPSGNYRVGGNVASGVEFHLILKSNVVLEGAGIGVSKLFNDATGAGANAGLVYVLNFSSKFGLYGLSLTGDEHCSRVVNSSWGTKSFIVGCRIEATSYAGRASVVAGLPGFGGKSVIHSSQFVSTHSTTGLGPSFTGLEDLVFKNNTLEYHESRVDFSVANRVQVDTCTFTRSTSTHEPAPGVVSNNYGGLNTPRNDFTLLNTTFNKSGSGAIPLHNDGESVFNELLAGGTALSKATSATSTTLTDSTVPVGAPWTAAVIGQKITITQGPGAGQSRVIVANTSNSVTVSPPWDVIPVANQSYFTIAHHSERHLIYGSTFNSVPRGIWYFRCAMDDLTIARNYFLNTPYPVLTRANQRMDTGDYGLGKEFNTFTGLLVSDNLIVRDANHAYPAILGDVSIAVHTSYVSGSELFGSFYYDAIIRSNAMGGVGSNPSAIILREEVEPSLPALVDNDTPATVGMIVEKNVINGFTNGIEINTGNYQNILWNNSFISVTNDVVDTTLPGHSHASVDTVINP